MAVAACVTYEVREGHGPQFEAVMATLRRHTLAEPGCLAYEPHRDPAHPERYFLYELYVDGDAYRAHQSSEHFTRLVLGALAEHVADKQVDRYEPLAVPPLRP